MTTTTEASTVVVDPEERLVGLLNEAALALMLSVGHRAGLLSALRRTGPVDPAGLAAAAGLQERYVREWLGALTVGRIVELDPADGRYRLPEEYADLLTDEGSANLAAFTQYIPVLAGVEDEMLRCFREGGGVGYESYPRFHEVMAADSAQTVLAELDTLVGLVPGLAERLEEGIDVLDVGCGQGRAVRALAAAYPRSRFTGLDLSESAIAAARDGAPDNARFVRGDATELTRHVPAGSVDWATTFDAVHDQAHPAVVVRGIRETLRPGGSYLAQDINTSGSHHGDLDHPLGPFLYTISCLHCMTVSLAQGGDGLGAAWGRPAAEAMFRDAGFAEVTTHLLPHDPQNAYYVCRG